MLMAVFGAGNTFAEKFTEAKILQAPPPSYPIDVKRAGIEGEVILNLEIDANGQVTNANINKGSGNELLDAAAVEGVKNYLYKPAERDGVKVESTKLTRVKFVLDPTPDKDMAYFSENDSKEEMEAKMSAYYVKKLKINGAYAWCGQGAYLKCFNESYTQCVDDMSIIKDDCASRADEKFPLKNSPASFGDYLEFFNVCSVTRHLNLHISEVVQVDRCLSGFKLDIKKFESDVTR